VLWYAISLSLSSKGPVTSKTVSIRLGFPGTSIATSLSFNLVSLASVLYEYFFVPHTAWVPLAGIGVWKGWGILALLGAAGISE